MREIVLGTPKFVVARVFDRLLAEACGAGVATGVDLSRDYNVLMDFEGDVAGAGGGVEMAG